MPADDALLLASHALAAREAGRPVEAVGLWRAVLAQAPQDWRSALALKADLAACGLYAEADPMFRQARRHFPDGIWLAHACALYAFPQAELASLITRARALAAAAPLDAARQSLLGHMLRQARDYAGAASAYARDPRPEARADETQARHLAALARWLADAPSFGPAPPIAVINLEANAERLAELDAQFAASRPRRFRVPGFDAGSLPAAAIARLGGAATMRGTLGCFLGHAAAWEAMLQAGLQHCLIVEDDASPMFDLPERWGMFGIDDGVDLCFVNERLAPPAEPAFRVHSLAHAMQGFPPWSNAPGADGYLLHATGARKLLALVAQDGFSGDVDWRLLAYGLTPEQCDALPADSHARSALRGLPHGPAGEKLDVGVLSPPLIRTVGLASDREDANRAGAS